MLIMPVTRVHANVACERNPPPGPAIAPPPWPRRCVCQACGLRTRLEVHHVLKRAQGGSDFDFDRLIALCRDCHDRTDAPHCQGRLVITPLGAGKFYCRVVWGSKWSPV